MTNRYYSCISFSRSSEREFPFAFREKTTGRSPLSFIPVLDFNRVIKMPDGLLRDVDCDEALRKGLRILWEDSLQKIKAGENPTEYTLKKCSLENLYKEFSSEDISFLEDPLDPSVKQALSDSGERVCKIYREHGFASQRAWAKENWGCSSNAEDLKIRRYKNNEKVYFVTEDGFPEKVFRKIAEGFPGMTVTEVHFDKENVDEDFYLIMTFIPGAVLKETLRRRENPAEFSSLDRAFSNIYPHIFIDR